MWLVVFRLPRLPGIIIANSKNVSHVVLNVLLQVIFIEASFVRYCGKCQNHREVYCACTVYCRYLYWILITSTFLDRDINKEIYLNNNLSPKCCGVANKPRQSLNLHPSSAQTSSYLNLNFMFNKKRRTNNK